MPPRLSPLSADAILDREQIKDCFDRLDHTARMMAAHWITQSVYVMAKLNLGQRLAEEPRTAGELAAATECQEDAMARVLRALVSLGLLQRRDGRFHLTELSRPLADPEDPLCKEAIRAGEHMQHTWGELMQSIRTGESSFEAKFGMPIFDYLAANPMVGAMFDSAMTGFHGLDIADLVDAYDFSECQVLADIGGGNASMLIAALERHPTLQGILFDLPEVAERAGENLEASEVGDRCQVVPGSFVDSDLPPADCLLLRHVIHNWPDDEARELLAKCRDAVSDGGRVVIAENLLPEHDRPHFGKLLDLAMLVIPGGRERNEPQFSALLDSAGLRLQRIVRTAGEMSAIEAVPQ